MAHGDVPEDGVAAEAGRLEKQFQVHHVVDDDGTVPSSLRLPSGRGVPRLYDAGTGAEPCRERLGGLHDHLFVAFGGMDAVTVEIGTADHKPDIVVPREILYAVQALGVAPGLRGPALVARELIEVPEASCEEAGAPVVDGYHDTPAHLVDGLGQPDRPFAPDVVEHQRILANGEVDVVVAQGCHRDLRAAG